MDSSTSHTPIKVTLRGLGYAYGELTRFLAPRTVEAILRKLPMEGRVALLKGGFYFQVPIKIGLEKSVRVPSQGSIAYWPLGNAVCFFNQSSHTYSPVNIVGKISVNEVLRAVESGMMIRMEQV